MKNILLFLSLFSFLLFIHGCLPDDCEIANANANYTASLNEYTPLPSLEVAAGQSIIFEPDNHFYIEYGIPGNKCDISDAYGTPNYSATVLDNSLASATVYTDEHSISEWGGGFETKVRIDGLSPGNTQLRLTATWVVITFGIPEEHRESFLIDLIING